MFINTMEAQSVDVSVSLTQEELFVILEYLKVPVLLGLDMSVIDELPEEQRILVLDAARRGLLARKIIRKEEQGNWHLDRFVFTIISTCVGPDYTVIIAREELGESAAAYFLHTAQGRNVLHIAPTQEIHQFILMRGERPLYESAKSILDLDLQDAPSCPAGELPEERLIKARDVARTQGIAPILSILTESQLLPETVQQLAETLSELIAVTTLVHIKHGSNGGTSEDGFTVLHGTNGLWLVKPVSGSTSLERQLSLLPRSAQAVLQAVENLVDTN